MHTPIWEGLNQCSLEYVYACKEPVDQGMAIASEFSAVSSILNGALRVNLLRHPKLCHLHRQDLPLQMRGEVADCDDVSVGVGGGLWRQRP